LAAITAAAYPSEVLRVEPAKVKPPAKEVPRIQREQKVLNALYADSASAPLFTPGWKMPIPDAATTSQYGSKRMYNGEMQSFHNGVDLRAAVGTPIYAPTAGVVKLSRDLYFTGNTVILDHGIGLFTVYAHMSELKVKEGDRVEAGHLLGLSGATGRVSGPHLHWVMSLRRLKVDPLQAVQVLNEELK
jgi:murein DD-endopeptidase MepM/ murein hydrolase activator NlpD